ncbi:MAG: polyprenol monophosphomannose synthase [Actinomycetes bacterium]
MVISKTLVIVPTYNEVANITDVIQRLKFATSDVDILIVDDNSPDGTGAVADSLIDPRTHVLHRSEKGGLGPAYLAGFHWGYDRGYESFVEMDADGSHQPEEVIRLIAASAGNDLVLGTRWMPGGSVVNWPISRRLISRFGTRYASLALGLSFRDLTSGYRLLSRRLIEDIFDSQLTTIGYGFQIEIVRIADSHERVIVEVPITFVERVAGSSKMSRKIVIEAWRKTTIWGLQRMVNRR